MRCPRCLLVDIPEGGRACVLCGYTPNAAAAAGGRARAQASAETDPRGSAVLVEEPPTELDARRELAAEFRIEALLRGSPEPIVYLAWEGDDEPLTLKAVQSEPAAGGGGPLADHFQHAAERAMRLEHAHIAPVYRFGSTDHFLWYAAKRVDGRSLDSILASVGALELPACVRILEQVASALDHAHRRGAAHGGLRSEHVIVDANEWVHVSDFVLAGLLQPPLDEERASEPAPRADQYALAVLAYECLTGTPTQDGGGPPLARLLEARTGIPLPVAQALRRALSGRPAERFPSVLDFVAALSAPAAPSVAFPSPVSAAAPPPAAASTPWFGSGQKRKPGSPVVIVADEEEEDEELAGPQRPPPPRPATGGKGGHRIAVAAGVVLVLASGVVWLNTPPGSASPARGGKDQAAGYTQPGPDTQWVSSPADTGSAPAAEPARVTPKTQPPLPRVPPPQPQPAARRPAPTTAKRTSPAQVARRTTPALPPPAPRRSERPAEPAGLSINAIPGGSVLIDGDAVGNTPQIDLRLAPGTHRLRVERDGFRPYEREIVLAPGQQLRITDITLVER